MAACDGGSTAADAAAPNGDAATDAIGDAGAAVDVLFDGVLDDAWRMSTIRNQPGRDDPGRFEVVDGALEARPGTDLGLLWHTRPLPADFELSLEWRRLAEDDNSGVFVRFPDLDSKGYDNTAYVAVQFGFEVQIDETGAPDGAPEHTTGAIYDQPGQSFTRIVARPVGEWNRFVVRVVGQRYEVELNGSAVAVFENPDGARGLPTAPAAPSFVGLQTHTGRVAFRAISVRAL